MNKEFLVKIIRAKQLEYEAIKEILPESVKMSLVQMEGKLINLAKECVTAMIFEDSHHVHSESAGNTEQEPRVRKVSIE